jgi:hypothetical protein
MRETRIDPGSSLEGFAGVCVFRGAMRKASEYRQHAKECRDLAVQMDSADQRALMLQMAEHWDTLAADRVALIRKHPELAREGEQDEERRGRPTA